MEPYRIWQYQTETHSLRVLRFEVAESKTVAANRFRCNSDIHCQDADR